MAQESDFRAAPVGVERAGLREGVEKRMPPGRIENERISYWEPCARLSLAPAAAIVRLSHGARPPAAALHGSRNEATACPISCSLASKGFSHFTIML